MALRVFYQRRWMIKTHRLIIEQSSRECSKVMAFQVGTGVSNQRETRGMGLWKSVKSERSNRLDDLLLCFSQDSIARHAGAQFFFDHFHSGLGTLETHGAA